MRVRSPRPGGRSAAGALGLENFTVQLCRIDQGGSVVQVSRMSLYFARSRTPEAGAALGARRALYGPHESRTCAVAGVDSAVSNSLAAHTRNPRRHRPDAM